MKKILLLFTVLFMVSACSVDDEPDQDYYVEFLPIDAVLIPDSVSVGHTYEVRAKYTKPNGCYLFDRFHTERDGDAVIIAVQTAVRRDGECKNYEIASQEEKAFTFTCEDTYASDKYIFKFYTGLDVEGNKTYAEVVIPVK